MENQIAEITEKKIAEFKPLPSFASNLVPTSVKEAMEMATMLSKSNIVPKDFYGKPENCFVAIGFGMEIGLPPLQAIQNIMVVNGRPSLWGDSVLALVMGSGLCEQFEESSSSEAMKQGFGRCKVKRSGMKEMEVTFSLDDAKKAGLLGKPGPWQQYMGRMLQLRARSWALRDCFPDVLKGIQVREEVDDYHVKRTIQMPQERNLIPGETIPSPDEANVVVIPKTTEERLAMAKEAYATTYQVTDQEMQGLISEYVAENDGNVTDESTLQFLNTLWTKLKKGEKTAEVVFKRGVAEKVKK